nr:MAG TPA: YtxH-like protein [Caudoviricetes sp.]
MDGVTILNAFKHLTNASPIAGIIILCLMFSALTLSMVVLCAINKPTWVEFGFIVAFAIGAIICGCLIPEKKYETRYQVTVDDSVSMNEFQSKYEIIEVEGKIYTVRERVE